MKTLVINRMAAGKDHTIEAVVNSSPEEGLITVYDIIKNERYWEDDTAVVPEDVTNVIDAHTGDITVRINSRGGEVSAALTMVNRLKDYDRGTVTTIVDGYAFSAAGMLAQAGKVRKICRGGIFMIHNPRMYPEISKLSDLESVKNNWEEHQKSILSVFENRTKITNQELKDMMEKETFLHAGSAVEKGFFDEIYEGKAALAALNYHRPKNMPADLLPTPSESCTKSAMNLHARSLFQRRQSLTQKKP
jgi:ATP-dependent Clp protease protease subunit